ncbi:hypothetical protein DFH08DRAFT_944602 [Mycena albidolilacea]|uniref:Uncharacterized protein n=1 Tax=Mycena albidolilacea TaxID=1033008 RepID=A0AAD7EAV7_9AGAR|nr:hypothetical protein DFH08DRAFT_944602 [Mycena albidolilacea]
MFIVPGLDLTPGAKADAPGFQVPLRHVVRRLQCGIKKAYKGPQVNKEQTKEGQRIGKICWVVKILPALCLTFFNYLSTQGPLPVFCPPVHDLWRTCPGGTWNPGASSGVNWLSSKMSNGLGKPQEKLHMLLGGKCSGRKIELNVQQFGAMDGLDGFASPPHGFE